MDRSRLILALTLSLLLGAHASPGEPSARSSALAVELTAGRLSVELRRRPAALPELRADAGGLTLSWGDGSVRFVSEEAETLRELRSDVGLRLTGDLRVERALAISAPTLLVDGRVSATALDLGASRVLEVERGASLTARGGAVALRADVLSLVGAVHTAGGEVLLAARAVLHAGLVSVDGGGQDGAGCVRVRCQRYVGTRAAAIHARSPGGAGGQIEVVATERVFSSGRYVATGARGGRVWISAADTRLAVATLDASGRQRGGLVSVGTRAAERPAGGEGWRAETVFASAGTILRADGTTGSGGAVVVGANGRTDFAAAVRVDSALGVGGEVELSASRVLNYAGQVEASGGIRNGQVLFDPQDLVLDDGIGTLAQYPFVDPNPDSGEFGSILKSLPNGNVVIADPSDDLGGVDAGACYLFDGTTGALLANLGGAAAGDEVASGGVTVLSNGNYLVLSPSYDYVVFVDAGAATWGDGGVGVSGVPIGNSLLGRAPNDFDILLATALTNGNAVVCAPLWGGGRGCVTWIDGASGISALVADTNSLVGSRSGDGVGLGGAVALTNGNYVAVSQRWSDGVSDDVGAVTWGDGTGGTVGEVTAANSLVGSTADDHVGKSEDYPGNGGVYPLTNGNYVVASVGWDAGAVADVGAVTWGDGSGGTVGVVSAANSLVGGTASDLVGADVVALTNGNYVVGSFAWSSTAGAATWGSGAGGLTGVVSATNSLVGSSTLDLVGTWVIALSNGNYVTYSDTYDGGRGLVAWGDGASGGLVGVPTTANSLIGSPGDRLGSGGVVALTNGNYAIASFRWSGGRGAATWGDGTSGTVGSVSAANSLVGQATHHGVGFGGITPLTNGHYVVTSREWDSITGNVGAVTWRDGTQATTGVVSVANSLTGSTAADEVGTEVVALPGGNYVIRSIDWSGGRGAVTWASGAGASGGTLSAANSLIGATASDQVGSGGVTALANGDYVVRSPSWDGAGAANAGAATWGNGGGGTVGTVGLANSLVGSTANDQVSSGGVRDLGGGAFALRSPAWDAGATSDAGAWTVAGPSASGRVSSANSLVGPGGASLVAGVPSARLGDGLLAGFVNDVISVGFRLGDTTYALASGREILTTTDRIVALLSAGVDVTLQASQDLTINTAIVVDNPSGVGGHLTLSAGRRVQINADVTTDGGDLTVISGDTLANGVVDADRGAGDAMVSNAATVDAGGGTVRFETRDSAGLTHSGRADYVLGTITAGATVVVPFSDAFSPGTAEVGSTTVTISGGGLSGATVTVGGIAANMISVASSQVTFNAALTTPSGLQPVVLTTASGSVPVGDLSVTHPLADLAVTKAVDVGEPAPGDEITYTVTIVNNGPGSSDAVALTDTAPGGTRLVLATPSRGSYDPGSGLWSVGVLASGASATLSLRCAVDAGTAETTITNTTRGLAGTNLGGSTADDVGSVAITPRQADLAVTMTVSDPSPAPGDAIAYTVTVTNQGPSRSDSVALTDALPAGVSLITATPSQGSYDPTSGLWTVGTLGSTASATLTLDCSVDAGTAGVTIVNATSGLTGSHLGGGTADDVGSATIGPQVADLGVTLDVDQSAPVVGSAITYTLTLTNAGPSDSDGVTLTDVIPAHLTFVSAAPSQGNYDAGSGLWSVGSLPSGASATLDLSCTVDASAAGRTVVNTTTGLAGTHLGGGTADDSASVAVDPIAQSSSSSSSSSSDGCSLRGPSSAGSPDAALLVLSLLVVLLRLRRP